MRYERIQNETRGNEVCPRCGVADSLFPRVRGLLGRKTLPAEEGLLIVPCPSIHMFGMKFALDVLFVTRDFVVTDFIENIPPGKAYVAKSRHGKPYAAIELAVGTIAQSGTQLGDKLSRMPQS